jgi:hypothetical protein
MKGLLGRKRSSASVLEKGRLGNDRRWWISKQGKEDDVIAGKWANRSGNTRFWQIRPEFSDDASTVHLRLETGDTFGMPEDETFLLSDTQRISVWLSEVLGLDVEIQENSVVGRPDSRECLSFSLISAATVSKIAEWFSWGEEETCRRLRLCVVYDGVEAFQEFAMLGRRFRLGKATFEAVEACPRCPVPGINPFTGVSTDNFRERFVAQMEEPYKRWALPAFRGKTAFVAGIYCNAVEVPSDTAIKEGDILEIL